VGPRARRAARAIERGRSVALTAQSRRDVAVLAVCLLFALGGLAMIGNGLFGLEPGERRHYAGMGILPGGVLVFLFFGVVGVPIAIWNLRGSLRAFVLDHDGLLMHTWCRLPWSSIVTAGVSGEGEHAYAWVELTPDGAAVNRRLVDDAAEVFEMRDVTGAPATAVLLPGHLSSITLDELAELVRLARARRRHEG
jgi:hypothetical protein